MHHGTLGILPSAHRNPWLCRDARFREFHAWSMRTLFYCSKYFRPVAQTLYPHNNLRSLPLHFYATNWSKRTGRRLCSACADQENENLISSLQASSGLRWSNDPCLFQGKYGLFQPGKTVMEIHGLQGTCKSDLDKKSWKCPRWFLILALCSHSASKASILLSPRFINGYRELDDRRRPSMHWHPIKGLSRNT